MWLDVKLSKGIQLEPKKYKDILNDYFMKLKSIVTKLELFDKLGNVYNMK